MTDFYSARCPRCDAEMVGTLAVEPDVPMYACGGWGRRCGRTAAVVEAPNIRALTAGDAVDLDQILDYAEAGLIHYERARNR